MQVQSLGVLCTLAHCLSPIFGVRLSDKNSGAWWSLHSLLLQRHKNLPNPFSILPHPTHFLRMQHSGSPPAPSGTTMHPHFSPVQPVTQLCPPSSLQILLAGTVPQEGPSQEAAAKVTCSWWVSGPQYILPPGSWNRPGHHLGSKLSNPSGTSLPFSCFSPLCSSTQAFLSLLFSLAS